MLKNPNIRTNPSFWQHHMHPPGDATETSCRELTSTVASIFCAAARGPEIKGECMLVLTVTTTIPRLLSQVGI